VGVRVGSLRGGGRHERDHGENVPDGQGSQEVKVVQGGHGDEGAQEAGNISDRH
jgi:hypothetical protein